MNLEKLFKMQKELDERILDRFPELRNENLLDKKILALQVELGELAQNWRGFKYWSEDRFPRTKAFKTVDTDMKVKTNPLLEEYVDCLHFILSIGNDLGMSETITVEWISEQGDYSEETTTDTFICLLQEVAGINTYHQQYVRDKYETAFLILIALGLEERHLGFTWEQIEQAYFAKNEENHQRQENGY